MMEKVIIDKMRDLIIVEKLNGLDVPEGTKFFCGCCGDILGVSSKELTFPFSAGTFNDSLKDKTFVSTRFGLNHKTCNHTMFTFKNDYGFMTLEKYIKQVPQN